MTGFLFFWRLINPSSVCLEFHLSRVYCKNYTICLNDRFKKDAIAFILKLLICERKLETVLNRYVTVRHLFRAATRTLEHGLTYKRSNGSCSKWFRRERLVLYGIWKKHPTFNCSKNTIINLDKETGSGERKKNSRRKGTDATSENDELVEELFCSQEEHPGTHYSIRQIASALSVSKTSVHCMVKSKGFRGYKRLTTLHMTNGCK